MANLKGTEMKKVLGVLLISLLTACASQTKQPGDEDMEDRDRSRDAATQRESMQAEDYTSPTLNPLSDPVVGTGSKT